MFQNSKLILPTYRARNTKLMKFEWVKSDLKRRFYELNKSSGKLVNTENVFEL